MKQSFKLFTFKGAPVELSIWFFLIFLIAPFSWSIIIFISVLIHEMAHAFVADRRGWRVFGIRIDIFSGSASIDSNIHGLDSIAVVAAGPLSNLILSIASLFLITIFEVNGYSQDGLLINILNQFFTANLIMFLFNILPIYPMDGGRILKDFLFIKMNNRKLAKKISGSVSLVFSLGLLIYSSITFSLVLIILSLLFIYLSLKEVDIITD